jgi:hypothetical protein
MKVRMPIQQLDVSSANNSFILTHLPLDTLHVDFGENKDTGGWLRQNYVYQRFISSLLDQTSPRTGESQVIMFHQSLVEKCARFIAGFFGAEVGDQKTLVSSAVQHEDKEAAGRVRR